MRDHETVNMTVALYGLDDRLDNVMLLTGCGIDDLRLFGQSGRRETEPAVVLRTYNYGQRNSVGVRERHFPAVSVAEVFEDYPFHIQTAPLFMSCRKRGRRRE